MTAEQAEVESLWLSLGNALNDQFISDSTENGVGRLEKIFKIVPKATDSIDVRKFRILTRTTEQIPYTVAALRQQLSALCGDEGYSLTVNSSDYKIGVKVELEAKGKFDEVGELLKRAVPANMVIDLLLMYNQHLLLANFTHAQLSVNTHDFLRNEVLG